ncbi:MAG: hypothetical protein H8D24_00215 [Gammaproteobacteria bacterium]|uniref:SPOR domain-containing protein n=1 Tax=Candidatus Thiopontia autotrophica TaxID=2841688 RepID=A0A8J6NV99_9GAMM|nr:hypothetical protein [Candidatus Thiopontia autotrophica]
MQKVIQIALVAGLIVLVILIKPKFSEDDPAGEYRILFGSYSSHTDALAMQTLLQQKWKEVEVEVEIVEQRYRDNGKRRVGYRLLSLPITGKLNSEKASEPFRDGGLRVRVVHSEPAN